MIFVKVFDSDNLRSLKISIKTIKYKQVMQEKDQNIFTYFRSIGKSNNLQTVSSRCVKPGRVIHSQQKYSANSFKNNILQKKDQNDSHHLLRHKINASLNKHNIANQGKQQRCFWPTDIIHDETGQTLKQLKSYIETHKINTYIKLNLSQNKYKNIKNQEREQFGEENKNINMKFQVKNSESQRKTLKKQNKSVPVLYSNINSHPIEEISIIEQQKRSSKNRRQKVIKIDYEVIKISKTKHKNKNVIIHYNSQQLNKNMDTPMNNQNNNTNIQNKIAYHSNNKIFHGDSDKINRKYSHNIINNVVSEEYLGKCETPMHATHHCQCQCICIKNQKNRQNMQASTKPTNYINLDVHQKQYLTPNTSTYFNTINSVDQLNSDRHHYQNNSQNSKNYTKQIRTMNKYSTNSKDFKYLQNSTMKSQIINEYLSNRRNGNTIKDPKQGQQNKNYLNQQCQQVQCSELLQYDSNNEQDKTSKNKNKYRSGNSKRFQRNSGMTGNSLNFNTSTYKKDTNSAMKMSGPI